jgi:hypothetical protein
MRYPARRENRRALLGDERFAANRPLVFTFQDLECFVLAMMNVWRRATARHVVRLNRADHTARVATVDANNHRNAEDVNLVASIGWDLDWFHNTAGDVLPFCTGSQVTIRELTTNLTSLLWRPTKCMSFFAG